MVEHRSPRPWLHIAVEVANEASATATNAWEFWVLAHLMEGPVYREKLKAAGIEHRIPGAEQRERIHRIIFDELVHGQFLPRTLAYLTEVIRSLKDEGCDAVVLGCTEIPLLMTQEQSPLPMLDSTRLLAKAALRKAVEGLVRENLAATAMQMM